MDSHSILDHDSGEVPLPGESRSSEPAGSDKASADSQADVRFPGEDGGRSLAEMAERDLTATLQLLAERAQYITGATGAAIALRDREEMVCRASAGPSAPEVGAQLQVNSGLSGESVRTRQTLRCDDSNTDERVNRESCEALGIRSVVVMPLLRGDEVIGVFELFSDQANVFETRDLAALERMGAMVHTALEHSAAALGLEPLPPDQTTRPSLPEAGNGHHGESLETPPTGDQDTGAIPAGAQEQAFSSSNTSDVLDIPSSSTNSGPGIAFHMKMPSPVAPAPLPARVETATAPVPAEIPAEPMADEADILEEAEPIPAAPPASESSDDILMELAEVSAQAQQPSDDLLPASGPVSTHSAPTAGRVAPPPSPEPRGAVAQLRKCESCGFPISEGRQLCLDCEKKSPRLAPPPALAAAVPAARISTPSYNAPVEPSTPDIVPNFLSGGDQEASWLSTHKLAVVAIAVALVGIVVVVLLR
jgi:putative methionine-R-sulfoxide reductase with GAF domain